MSIKQCRHVEPLVICCALQESILPSNIQRDILAVPLTQIGMKKRIFYGTQVKKHICALMNFGNINCITGHYLRDTIETHKLGIVCSGILFYNNVMAIYQCAPPLSYHRYIAIRVGGKDFIRRKY